MAFDALLDLEQNSDVSSFLQVSHRVNQKLFPLHFSWSIYSPANGIQPAKSYLKRIQLRVRQDLNTLQQVKSHSLGTKYSAGFWKLLADGELTITRYQNRFSAEFPRFSDHPNFFLARNYLSRISDLPGGRRGEPKQQLFEQGCQ